MLSGFRWAKLFLIILLLLFATRLQAQGAAPASPSQSQEQSIPPQTGSPPPPPHQEVTPQARDVQTDSESERNGEGRQTNRMFWLVPNFSAVSANTQLPRLSTREKFVLSAQDSLTDYSSYTWTAVLAGQGLLLNSDPEFGHGAAAYGRYYWHNFVDGVSGTFFTEAIVPAITHEDPRYYTLGQGGFFRRTAYAISRAFVTKTDSGSREFNWSEVGGNGLEALLSNAYYPAHDRGARQTAKNWGTQMESAVLNHIFQEFWPDIRTKLFRRK